MLAVLGTPFGGLTGDYSADDAVIETEFVAAMRAMGECIKAFIHAYRESSKQMQQSQSQRKLPPPPSHPAPSFNGSSGTLPMATSSPYDSYTDSGIESSGSQRSRPDVQYSNAELSGWLTKQGGGVKSWKRRWCVLKDGFISYFKEADNTQPLGAIPLEGCNSVTMH